jgi:hypothetical protein
MGTLAGAASTREAALRASGNAASWPGVLPGVKMLPISRRGRLATALVTLIAATAAASPAPGAQHAATPCGSTVRHDVLPPWARDGFSEPRPRIDHVLGRSGGILAILFADPLYSPPAADRNNKILWVAHRQFDFGDMHIRAQHMQGGTPIGKPVARRVPGGPGPSIIDVPAAGCWRFTLTWKTEGLSGGKAITDTLDLRYVKPARK